MRRPDELETGSMQKQGSENLYPGPARLPERLEGEAEIHTSETIPRVGRGAAGQRDCKWEH